MIIAGSFFFVCNLVLINYDDFCYDLEIQVVDVIIFFLFHCLFLLCLFDFFGIFIFRHLGITESEWDSDDIDFCTRSVRSDFSCILYSVICYAYV